MRERVLMRPTREGLIVRDPITMNPLLAEGELKPRSQYWLRRIKDGDVEVVEPTKKPAPARKKATTNEGDQ